MRKLLVISLLLATLGFGGCVLRAENGGVAGGWGGLHNSDTSMGIGDNEAQDLLNVDLTDSGFGVKKRSGYSQFRTIGNSTMPVRGGYYWRDAGGNDEVVYTNDRSIYKSVNSGAFAAFVTTDTSNSYYDFTDSNGWLYRATSNHDQILRYNGTTVEYSTAPKGSIIEMLSDRLLIAGTTDYPNRLYYSKRADFTDFTPGLEEASAFTYDHGLPGQAITAVKAWNNGVLVWTKSTLSYVVYDSQNDLTPVSKISGTIGTLQPYTVIDDYGVVYFQAQDKHWYSFDGNGLQKLSMPIDVSKFRNNDYLSWIIDTDIDFDAGTLGYGLESVGGEVRFSTLTIIDDFSDGNFTSNPTWSTTTFFGGGAFHVDSDGLYLTRTPPGDSGRGLMYTANIFSTGTWSFTYKNGPITTSKTGLQNVWVGISTAIPPDETVYNGYLVRITTTQVSIYSGTSLLGFAATSIGDSIAHTIEFQRSSAGVLRVSVDGSSVLSVTNTTFSNFPYVYIAMDNDAYGHNPHIDNLRYYIHDSTYTSYLMNVGEQITSWSSWVSDDISNGATITRGLYGCDTSACSATSFTSSQTITSGQIPTISTHSYAFWKINLNRTTYTQNPSIYKVTTNWEELNNPVKLYGSVDDNHRLIWAVAEGTATAPNASYLYDQRFNAWLKYDFPFQAPVKVGDSLYFGGVSTGVVYNWPSGNTDNGAAITSYWKSKDFIGTDPYTEKDFTRYNIVAKSQTGSNLDFTYTVNTTTAIARNYSLTDANGNSIKRINENIASGKFGTFFNFKFGNDDGDAPFEIYAVGYEYKPKPWRVLP